MENPIIQAFHQAHADAIKTTGGSIYNSQQVEGLSTISPSTPLSATLHLLNGEIININLNQNKRFLIQSCFKPLTYAYAIEHNLSKQVNQSIGKTGDIGYAANTLDTTGKAFNPLINTGALAVLELLARHGHTLDTIGKWCRDLGTTKTMNSDNTASTSSSSLFNAAAVTATEADSLRNRGLACMMAAAGIMPKTQTSVDSAVQYYAAMDCLSINTLELASIAAAFASTESVLSSQTKSSVLASMLHCGMYEASGVWMSEVGLPAKSGVSGAVWCVIPGVGGLAAYQPLIDEVGNSVQAMALIKSFVKSVPSLSIFL